MPGATEIPEHEKEEINEAEKQRREEVHHRLKDLRARVQAQLAERLHKASDRQLSFPF